MRQHTCSTAIVPLSSIVHAARSGNASWTQITANQDVVARTSADGDAFSTERCSKSRVSMQQVVKEGQMQTNCKLHWCAV
jgi:hypothetical protein